LEAAANTMKASWRISRFLRFCVVAVVTMAAVIGAPTSFAQQAQPRPGVLAIAPESGAVGSLFTVSGQSTPGADVEIQWTTWDGAYTTQITSQSVAYKQRAFTEKRVSLGRASADDQGRFSGSFTVPEDYGHLHDIHAMVDGQDVARGAFQVMMAATATPESGPIGTPIQLRVTGLNPNLFSGSTLAVRYDNAYTGLLTATTTGGTAEAVIRATGPLGTHSIVIGAGTTPGYLNIHQSPYDFLYTQTPDGEGFQFKFITTVDNGPPANTLEWPASDAVRTLSADEPRTTLEPLAPSDARVALDPSTGPILTRTRVSASGLRPGADAQAVWMTARGNRVSDSGWDVVSVPLGQTTPDQQGAASFDVEIPDDLGGWHELKLVQDGVSVAQSPFFVERSLASVSTSTVRAGDTVTIQAKGLGWTELDNGFAVTYDNKFVGYACGFNSNGDVTMPLIATGEPGTHLIDMYPMVYNGQDRKAWYWAPVLTFARDFPALNLGYRIPAYRLAISITQ
jgi:hypothetical protein